MNVLSGEDLLAWVDTTSERWRSLLLEHPQAMDLPCDVMDVGTVAKLLQHIVAVELRYLQRLVGETETPYEEVGYGSADEIFATHTRVSSRLRDLMAKPDVDWEERIAFKLRNGDAITASRRTVLVHLLMHSVRHYAQLATLVRQHGIKPGWPMDYLMMGAKRV